MSTPADAQTNIESPALALRNIGLSSRDLMAAINRMGLGLENISLNSVEPSAKSTSDARKRGAHALESFTRFGELPSELRIKIWSYVCFQPRNVDIFTETLGTIRVSDGAYFDSYKFFSHFCSHPAILYVCRESREESLKHYKLEFGTSHQFSIVNISTPPRIYVNFACDRLCLLKPECFGSDHENGFQRFVEICRKHGARSLAVNVFDDQHWPFVDVATSLNALEELVLFESNTNFDYEQTGVPIDFILLGAHRADLYQDAAERQLEIARRDFLALFEMHKDGLQFDISFENGISSAKTVEKLSWRAPVVEISHLVIDGKHDATNWTWNME